MEKNGRKTAFIGVGNIAGAVIGGLLGSAFLSHEDIILFDTDSSKYQKYADSSVHIASSITEAVSMADYVFLALKPAHIKGALTAIELDKINLEGKVFISVAASVSTDYICSCLKREVPVVRVMPNTPMLIGEGAVAICKNSFVNKKQFEFVCLMFSKLAVISAMDEDKMNTVIAVNGSSPAYVYLFVKAMLDGAKEQGIPEEAAYPLILQTVIGSVKMLEHTKKSPDELISVVTSPNGTTLAAMEKLYGMGFENVVKAAMQACTDRAEEIAKELP